jgi:hypothetical protein
MAVSPQLHQHRTAEIHGFGERRKKVIPWHISDMAGARDDVRLQGQGEVIRADGDFRF